jgi:hypothetical protein
MMDAVEPRALRPATGGSEFAQVRAQTLALVEGLSAEDCMVQSMAEASPVKWHLAHVTWFFETLVLERLLPTLGRDFRPFRPEFRVLFNSYYVGVGAFHPRTERGVLSRPSLAEVLAYRELWKIACWIALALVLLGKALLEERGLRALFPGLLGKVPAKALEIADITPHG